ncbi:MAG: crossover junction endodeoxyribonuclease RuvC [Acetobacteraceae bacterium]|nr:crossover junction endodeoxyribonuclease RuvC [Acetobacteraceae bacterium]
MLVLGVDPGTASTGYGLVRGDRSAMEAVGFGTVRTPPGAALPERLLHIYRELSALIQEHRPDLVAVEEVFFNRNVRSALSVGHARGVVLLAAADAGVRVAEYSPLAVKAAVAGYGRADKAQVQRMVAHLLALTRLPRPDHVADALAVAVCCLCSRPLPAVRGEGGR